MAYLVATSHPVFDEKHEEAHLQDGHRDISDFILICKSQHQSKSHINDYQKAHKLQRITNQYRRAIVYNMDKLLHEAAEGIKILHIICNLDRIQVNRIYYHRHGWIQYFTKTKCINRIEYLGSHGRPQHDIEQPPVIVIPEHNHDARYCYHDVQYCRYQFFRNIIPQIHQRCTPCQRTGISSQNIIRPYNQHHKQKRICPAHLLHQYSPIFCLNSS